MAGLREYGAVTQRKAATTNTTTNIIDTSPSLDMEEHNNKLQDMITTRPPRSQKTTSSSKPYLQDGFKPSKGDFDERSGYVLFCSAQESDFLWLAATIANLLVDDPVYIIGLSIGWLGTLFARNMGFLSEDSCAPEAWNEMYFCFMMWSATESAIKLITQKPRPAYTENTAAKRGILIPGDQFSFPSGHTLRAFGTARVIFNNPVVAIGFGTPELLGSAHGNIATTLLWFAAVVGWSRVALGKHSPVDVLGGMALGVLFGELFWSIDSKYRFMFQMACVTYYCFIGLLCVLGVLGAPVWVTARDFWGFKSKTQQAQFFLLVVGGTLIFLFGRTSCSAVPMPTLSDML